MTFLAMVFGLLLNQFWEGVDGLRQDDWFLSWRQRVASWSIPAGLQLVVVVLLPCLLAYWILDILAPILFGLFWLAAAVFLLLYSMGRGDYAGKMADYRQHARSGDFQAVFLEGEMLESPDGPDSTEDVHALAQGGLLYAGYQRWFAVLFYFLLLGPVGALAYRLLQLCRDSVAPELVERCLHIVDWPPSRLLAATFVVTGNFVASVNAMLEGLADGQRGAGELLYDVGSRAVDLPRSSAETFAVWAAQENEELSELLKRSAGAWLVLVSLYVILL